jgi:predicted anti-sigma-YlaC factor YlaD
MNEHLNEDQRNALLLAEADAESSAHLNACEACRNEVEQLRGALAGLRSAEVACAERPQEFWREQRLSIAARIPVGNELTTQPLAWAASLAGILIVAAMLSQGLPVLDPSALQVPAKATAQVASDPDHDLLVEIGRSIRRDVPLALEPASLIAQELHRAANKTDQ